MKIEKIKEIIYERLNKLTYDEREWIKYNLAGWYNTYLFKHNMDEFSDNTWQSLWCWSAFGDCYDRNKTLAKKFLSCEKKMNYVMDRMEDRKMWYDTGVTMIKNLYILHLNCMKVFTTVLVFQLCLTIIITCYIRAVKPNKKH